MIQTDEPWYFFFKRSWNPPTTLIRFHPKLQTIQSNILHCDCNALWLQAWLKNRTALASSKISCASPETFKGKELLQVKETAFPCGDYSLTFALFRFLLVYAI